jgi:TonB-dependent SusC/RagA subfamily outer membrane receptor
MKTGVLMLVMLSLLCFETVTAQKNNKKITINGTVMDASDHPVSNAIVMIDGKNTSVVTGQEGEFKIKVRKDAERLGIFTFTNGIKEEAIGGRTEINFKFATAGEQKPEDQGVEPGDEAVNTGYSYVKKKNLTKEISRIDGTDKKYTSYRTIYEMITREVPGVRISGNDIIIQDSKDFFGSVKALIIVDGVYVDDISNISPTVVESIEVLKGTAASMYGSRGYGGAVIIKTKINN